MASASSKNLRAALRYIRRGWWVLPCWWILPNGKCACGKNCNSPGKHPIPTHGVNDASNDEDRIRRWWESYPDANIAIATGKISGIIVVDIDGEKGKADLAEWERIHGPLPKGPTVRTGGGGFHRYLCCPPNRDVGNRTKLLGRSIDVRGDGGYVIAPDSNHKSGNPYEWDEFSEEFEPPLPPDWMIAIIESREAPAAQSDEQQIFDKMTQDLNLDTAPGVPEGQRHDTALRLIGSAFGKGENPFDALGKAFKWADRCAPPYDKADILKIAADLWRKEMIKEQSELEQVEWPELHPDALYGLAGEIVAAIGPHTEADPAAIMFQLFAYFGNVIGRSAFHYVESTKHFANLFVVLVGDTANARKGTSEGRIRELFRNVDADWVRGCIKSGLSSGEGLIFSVRDPAEKDGEAEKDPGVADKRLLVIESEFGGPLRITKREGNILTVVIRDAWDHGNLNQMVKNFPARATGAHLSIIGHITTEELMSLLTDVDAFNGYANRYLWICVTRSKLLPEGGGFLDMLPFSLRIAEAVEFARNVEEMNRSDEAKALWDTFYRAQANKKRGGRLGAVTSRSAPYTLRLSMIYALLDRSAEIRSEHLKAAIALWNYAEDSAKYIFGTSTGNALADRILAILRSQGPKTRRELHDSFGRHLKQAELAHALEFLRKSKLAKCERDNSTGGRPAERWSAI